MQKYLKICSLLLFVQGCSINGSENYPGQPKMLAFAPTTKYSEALSCLQKSINEIPTTYSKAEKGKNPANKVRVADSGRLRGMILPIPIGIGFIPDATGRVLPGLRGMVTTTTASLLTSWDKFQVSEIATTGNALIQSLGSKPDSTGALIAVPKVEQTRGLQIVGSLTQADSTVEDKSLSLGVSSSQNSFGLSGGKTKSTIALDLYLINIEDGLRIIGSTSSALTVTNLSVGGNASLQIGAVGIELDAEVHENEGPHWAARQLVELSVLTLLGEAAGVNYQGCLTGLPLTGPH